jgi:lauroyl/myristoyl acyltransferase
VADPPDLEARLAALARPGRHERGGSLWQRSRVRIAPGIGRLVPREVAVRRAVRAGERQWEDSKAARKKAARWMAMMLHRPANDPEVQRLAREAVIDWSVRQVLIERVWEASREGRVHGPEHFEEARAGGRGVLVVGTHFALGMNGMFRLTKRYGPCYVVRAPRDVDRRGRNTLIMRRRWLAAERQGVRFVDRKESYPVMRALLERGEICALAFDAAGRVETDLAGQRTWLAGGAAELALDAGVPVMVGMTLRDGTEQVGHWAPPLESGDFADARALHQRIAEILSPWILDHLPQLYPHQLPQQPRGSWNDV